MNDVKRSMDRARSGGMGRAARRFGALAGALLAGGALAQSGGVQWVQPDVAAEVTTPPAMVDETPSLWFVELSGAPTADGGSAATVATQHKTFRDAMLKSGVAVRERQEFSALFNGFSIAASARDLGKIRNLGGVAAIHPVFQVTRPQGTPSGTELFTALGMTGADIAQNTLGLTGRGVTVGIIDTGIDYDNADLGGDGVARSNSPMFPNKRVVKGWDFVGDAYNADPASAAYNITLAPDALPDDCAGHGTHVAGIVGGRGVITGVAPGVKLASYRVFGCAGSTNDDVLLAAMERALKDRVDVINMSLGSPFGWPTSPTAKAADRLVRRGIVVVASAGNDGASGLYSTGGPSAGAEVLSVASVDNVGAYIDYLTSGGQRFGWLPAAGAPPPPASGTLPLARTGTPTTTNDGCTALPAGSLAGQAVLIRRGTCSFYIKSINAQNAGAAAVVLYNNTSGFISPTVAGNTPAITIPVVAVLASDGAILNGLVAAGGASISWTGQQASFPNPTGNLLSSFSSYGLTPDLAFKPDIAAPGGSIYSSFPVELGGHASLSGTSMAAPHVAGAVALLLESRPWLDPQAVRHHLLTSAEPRPWAGAPTAGYLETVVKQGAGELRIDKAITSSVFTFPSNLALGESQEGPVTTPLTIISEADTTTTFDLSYVNGLSVAGTFVQGFATSDAKVTFPSPSITVSANSSKQILVTVTPPTAPDKALYGGWIVITPRGGGSVARVPFSGFVGDYQSIKVLAPTANGFPWLAGVFDGQYYGPITGPADWWYSMVGEDIPTFLVHFDHQARLLQVDIFDAATGKTVGEASTEDYLPRNSTSTGFFALPWDGTVTRSRRIVTVPSGLYVARISVLKALGHAFQESDWERWTSPVIEIRR